MNTQSNNNIKELLAAYNKQEKENSNIEQIAYDTDTDSCCCCCSEKACEDVCTGACACNLCCG